MSGYQDGKQWIGPDGTKHTANSANDPGAAGGYYYSQVDAQGNKATAVFNSNGTLANVKSNSSWKSVPTQGKQGK